MTKLNDFINDFPQIEKYPYPKYTFSSKKISKENLIQEFTQNWELAGGKSLKISEKKRLFQEILKFGFLTQNASIYSTFSLEIDSSIKGEFSFLKEKEIQKPQDFDNLDVLFVEAKLGVANQGALWIPKNTLPYDAGLFLCKHQVILINKKSLYYNMEEAITKHTKLFKHGGFWIAGPSKTADIEQSLVIGAHGPLTSIAVLY
jgi:L-lactate dehydrogenase complex protein LldG